jgi:hypothetical protein
MKKAPAHPRDAYGERIYVGDTVRAYRPRETPSTYLRRVTSLGDPNNEHLRGTLLLEGAIAWESARHFEKVQP